MLSLSSAPFGLVLLLSLAATVLPAQEKADSAARSCRFAVASLPAGVGKEVFVLGKDGPVSVPLSLYRFSPALRLEPEQKSLRVFLQRPVLGGSAEKPAYPAADLVVPIDAGAKKSLVVLFPSEAKEEAKPKLDAHAIDEAKFPKGSIYFFNPTSVPVGAMIGEKKEGIGAGNTHLFETPPLGAGKTFGVQIALHREEGWKLFSSTRWHLTPRERHLVFFKINPRTGKVDYDSMTDYLD